MLESKNPREQSGRDSFGRYRAQVRSAAIASLSILEDDKIDRVYCDLHDDFVVRRKDDLGLSYLFYQVKTNSKTNKNYSIRELFGIKKTRKKDVDIPDDSIIKNSFVGKLLLHTVVFDENCHCVTFQTNIRTDDDVQTLLKDIESKKVANKYLKILVERFNTCYEDELEKKLSQNEILGKISKLSIDEDVQYLKEDHLFEPFAREKIHEFSEIDLTREELKEILLKLVDLVERKSSGVIKELTSESIEKLAGIAIEDLLSILSISKTAYETLKQGGDPKAIKSASIIQRTLEKYGAGPTEIQYCTKCKTEWDAWVRNKRHVIPELEFNSITQEIKHTVENEIKNSEIILGDLLKQVKAIYNRLKQNNIEYDLNDDLIVGAVFSELVRKS